MPVLILPVVWKKQLSAMSDKPPSDLAKDRPKPGQAEFCETTVTWDFGLDDLFGRVGKAAGKKPSGEASSAKKNKPSGEASSVKNPSLRVEWTEIVLRPKWLLQLHHSNHACFRLKMNWLGHSWKVTAGKS